jgi:hypothetical protein
MYTKKAISIIRLLVAFTIIGLFFGCGGGGGGGGTGSGENTITPDIKGIWNITEHQAADTCGDSASTDTYRFNVTVSGNDITVIDPDDPEAVSNTSTLSGNIATFNLTEGDDGDGWTGTTHVVLTFSSDGKTLTAEGSWTETNGTESCSGTFTLSGTKSSGSVAFTNASLKGIWISSASTISTNKERAYFILDGNGKITDTGGFGMNTANPGTYSVSSHGAISITFNATNASESMTVTGNMVSSSEFLINAEYQGTPETIYFDKVTDPSLCKGTWTGTVTGYGISDHAISFTVDPSGVISNFTGFSGTVTGKIFGLNGVASAHCITSEIAPFDEFSIVGALSGNTITGYFIADQNATAGTAVLNRTSN